MIDYSLYLITDPDLARGRDNVVPTVLEAVEGGVTVVQLRDKTASDEEIEAMGRELLDQLGDIPLFINDRVEVAARLGCHAHVGQSDMAMEKARELLGPDQLLGVSASTPEEIKAAASADVVGIGPVFSTATKADAPEGMGVEAAAKLATHAREVGTTPVAIGGIKGHNAADFTQTDFAGICVVSDIMAADDPAAAARELKGAYRG